MYKNNIPKRNNNKLHNIICLCSHSFVSMVHIFSFCKHFSGIIIKKNYFRDCFTIKNIQNKYFLNYLI